MPSGWTPLVNPHIDLRDLNFRQPSADGLELCALCLLPLLKIHDHFIGVLQSSRELLSSFLSCGGLQLDLGRKLPQVLQQLLLHDSNQRVDQLLIALPHSLL